MSTPKRFRITGRQAADGVVHLSVQDGVIECTRDEASERKVTVNIGEGSEAWVYVDADGNKAIWVPTATAQEMIRELGIETGPANEYPFFTISRAGTTGDLWRINLPARLAHPSIAATFSRIQLGQAISVNIGDSKRFRLDSTGRIRHIIGPSSFCTRLLSGRYFQDK